MPELPEVETVRQGLEEALLGLNIRNAEKRRRDLRFPIPGNLNEKLQG
ncbi:MAG: DNA-formamidopyrimidine glycosylase, partial [Euryarchaeota archaeon]|nr:DNA-formamidopyrimidine glycosylase [Euryarchaeota archaeon]